MIGEASGLVETQDGSLQRLLASITSLFLFGRRVRAPATPMSPKEAQRTIKDYGALVERSPPSPLRIEDVSKLPHPKETILTAVCLVLATIGDDDEFASSLKRGALGLAQYQPDVGDEPLHFFGFDLTEEPDLPPEEAIEQIASNPTEDRYKRFNALVEKDIERIQKILIQVEVVRGRTRRAGR